MQRRDFLKSITLATAGLSVTNLYGFGHISLDENGSQLYAQRQSKLCVIADVDVLVVGGSAAGIAAAVNAAKAGASVYLIAAEPYLGSDICGTLRLWDINKGEKTAFSQSLLRRDQVPEPAHVKRVLQNHLMDNDIDFILSTYAGGVILDEENEISGVVVVNRSGEQIIKAPVVIDATETALVARMAGKAFHKISRKPAQYRYTVVGNIPKTNLDHTALPPLVFKEKSYPVTVYRFNQREALSSFNDYQILEQTIRDKTWDVEQVDSSDILFEIPNVNVKSSNRTAQRFQNAGILPLSALQPAGSKRLFVLNAYADVAFDDKDTMLLPGNMISLGQRLGTHACTLAKSTEARSLIRLEGRTGYVEAGTEGVVYNRFMRPVHQKDVFVVENEKLPILGVFDNVVVGGGTAGACAGVSSARYGSKTLVVEYLHGLGGMGTMGLIGRYWVGYRDGFTKEIDEGVRNMASADHPRQRRQRADWVKDWKMEWYRREIQKPGGTVWFGAMACGAVVEGKTVRGIVVSTPFGKGVVMAKNVIDSTGSADIAIAAGAKFEFIDADSVALQGSGLPKVDPNDHYNNTDYTFTDDTDMMDVTRTFVAGNAKFRDVYDVGKLPQTRERRRIVGDYRVTAMDMANDRYYDDTISYHFSSFDTHGYTVDPYFIIKPPAGHTVDRYVNVPLRALLPEGLNNIIVTGLGASADRDAMPIIRMQPCLQNQGYSVGYLATLTQKAGISFREIDFSKVINELISKGTLPSSTETGKDLYPPTDHQIREAVKAIVNDFDQLERVLWDKDRGLKILKEEFDATTDPNLKSRCAAVLGFYGYADVCNVLVKEISQYSEWDKGWNFRGMHQFGMSASYLDALVMSLGKTGNKNGWDEIRRLAALLTAESELSHFRAIAEACADLKGRNAAALLHRLLSMPGVGGYAVTSMNQAVFYTKKDTNDNITRNNSLKELFLARALFICGDYDDLGHKTLMLYANDLHGLYSNHALDVLKKYA
jgi:ribulose 1,5-bisphosphate synthetase/thiazole synthase